VADWLAKLSYYLCSTDLWNIILHGLSFYPV